MEDRRKIARERIEILKQQIKEHPEMSAKYEEIIKKLEKFLQRRRWR